MKYFLVAKKRGGDPTLRPGDGLEMLGDGKKLYCFTSMEEAERVRSVLAIKDKRPIIIAPETFINERTDFIQIETAAHNIMRQLDVVISNAASIEGFAELDEAQQVSAMMTALTHALGQMGAQIVRHFGDMMRSSVDRHLKEGVIGAFEDALASPSATLTVSSAVIAGGEPQVH